MIGERVSDFVQLMFLFVSCRNARTALVPMVLQISPGTSGWFMKTQPCEHRWSDLYKSRFANNVLLFGFRKKNNLSKSPTVLLGGIRPMRLRLRGSSVE